MFKKSCREYDEERCLYERLPGLSEERHDASEVRCCNYSLKYNSKLMLYTLLYLMLCNDIHFTYIHTLHTGNVIS